MLPKGKEVQVETMLYGLLLPSGNDAAIALALRVSGTRKQFIALMNARRATLGLGCTPLHVGQRDHRPAQLLVHERPRRASPRDAPPAAPGPHHPHAPGPAPVPDQEREALPLQQQPDARAALPGHDGVKTGYTEAAGACLVATVRRGSDHLGVVMLNSVDPRDQSERLYAAGFAAMQKARSG